MSRTADFAIQGFLYQFIITLQKILQSPSGANVTIVNAEGKKALDYADHS